MPPRMKAMTEVSRRPTMQEIQAQRRSSVGERRLAKTRAWASQTLTSTKSSALGVTTSPKPVTVFTLPDFPSSMTLHSTQSYYCSLIHLLDEQIFSIQSENPSLLARCFCSFPVLHHASKRCRFKPHLLTPGSSSYTASSTSCAHAGWTPWLTSRTCTGWTPPSSPPGWSHGW